MFQCPLNNETFTLFVEIEKLPPVKYMLKSTTKSNEDLNE